MSPLNAASETSNDPGRSTALIVAHGAPSDPSSQEEALARLAARVGAHLPGWRVLSATLAGKGTLEAAARELPDGALVFPVFMSDGWFVSHEVPRRLDAAGVRRYRVLSPLGLQPAVADRCARAAQAGLAAHGLEAAETALLIAGHGSPGDPRPRRAVERVASVLRARAGFREVVTGYVDEAPRLADAARLAGPALCLPFFATRAGHVEVDVPKALSEAAFPGPMLDPIGLHPEIPEIIAVALARSGPGGSAGRGNRPPRLWRESRASAP